MDEMPPMGNDFPSPQGQEPNPYDADFDAGVEADEESDPKRFIQQLTGKLAQSLRSYNSGLPQPDADLSKYVAGMIVKQAVDGLSQEDTTDILNKVSGKDGGVEPEGDDTNSDDQFGESVERIKNLNQGDNDEPRDKIVGKRNGYKRAPFTPKRFA